MLQSHIVYAMLHTDNKMSISLEQACTLIIYTRHIDVSNFSLHFIWWPLKFKIAFSIFLAISN